MKKNQDLIDVYQDTKEAFEGVACTSESTVLDLNTVASPSIRVINQDSVSCLQDLDEARSGRVCVLNMASYKRPGGGVENGAKAQEEALFRCSNLHQTMIKQVYPLQSGEFIYSTDVIFIKDFHYKPIPWITADVVSVPAINLNAKSYYDPIQEDWVNCIQDKPKGYEELTKSKIRAMLKAAHNHNVKVMVLGAWGCGVFKNSPQDIALMFKEVLVDEKYMMMFDQVVFPVINDKNSHGNNYEVFKTILDGSEE